MGGIVALFFDGAVCNFNELPLPNDNPSINKVYNYLNTIRGISSTVLLAIRKKNNTKLLNKIKEKLNESINTCKKWIR